MCSYCGCRANTVIARYSAEHDEIVNAMGILRRTANPLTAAKPVPKKIMLIGSGTTSPPPLPPPPGSPNSPAGPGSGGRPGEPPTG